VDQKTFLASLSKTRFVCLRELSLQDEAEEDLAPLQTVLEAVAYKVGFFTLGEIQANTNGILGVFSSYNEGLIYAGAIWKFLYDCSKSVNGKSVLQWCHEVASAFTNEIKASRFKNAAQRPQQGSFPSLFTSAFSYTLCLLVEIGRAKNALVSKMETIGPTKRAHGVRFFNHTRLRAAGRSVKGYSPRGKCIRY